MKVTFTLPSDCSSVIVGLKVENASEKGIVEFDDVRIVIRTTPSMLRLKPATRYKVTCNYIADNDFYRLVVQGNIRSSKSIRLDRQIVKGTGTIMETFATGSGIESFLAIFKNNRPQNSIK